MNTRISHPKLNNPTFCQNIQTLTFKNIPHSINSLNLEEEAKRALMVIGDEIINPGDYLYARYQAQGSFKKVKYLGAHESFIFEYSGEQSIIQIQDPVSSKTVRLSSAFSSLTEFFTKNGLKKLAEEIQTALNQ